MPYPPLEGESDEILSDLYFTKCFFLFQLVAQFLVAAFVPFYKAHAAIVAALSAFVGYIVYEYVIAAKEPDRQEWHGIKRVHWVRYDTVWFYIFILGLFLTNLNIKYQNHFILNFSETENFEYLIDICRVSIISILAFLAGNIVSQMMGIKSGYEKMTATAEEANKNLEGLKDKIRDIAYQYDLTRASLILFEGLINSSPSKNTLYNANLLTRNLKETIEIFTDKLASPNGGLYPIKWDLIVLNRFLAKCNESFDTRIIDGQIVNDGAITFITPYSNLKKIVADFVTGTIEDLQKEQRDSLDFYALFSLNPIRYFLRKPEEEFDYSDFDGCLKIHHSAGVESSKYPMMNFLLNKEKYRVKIKRVFLNIKDDLSVDKNAKYLNDNKIFDFSEIRPILNLNFDKGLGDPAGKYITPILANIQENLQILHDRKDSSTYNHFLKYQENLQRISNSNEIQTLQDLLVHYHGSANALVLEANLNYYVEQLTKEGKPLDYFGIKQNLDNGSEWMYILETQYDESFDIAKIRILNRSHSADALRTLGKKLEGVFAEHGTRKVDLFETKVVKLSDYKLN